MSLRSLSLSLSSLTLLHLSSFACPLTGPSFQRPHSSLTSLMGLSLPMSLEPVVEREERKSAAPITRGLKLDTRKLCSQKMHIRGRESHRRSGIPPNEPTSVDVCPTHGSRAGQGLAHVVLHGQGGSGWYGVGHGGHTGKAAPYTSTCTWTAKHKICMHALSTACSSPLAQS